MIGPTGSWDRLGPMFTPSERLPMIDALSLVTYCDALLDVGTFSDYAPNGLQVEGERPIVHLVSGVTACAALIDATGWVAKTVDQAVANRHRLIEELTARGVEALPSAANFVMVPVEVGTAVETVVALRRHDVGVRPFPACPDVGDAVRVTVGPWPLMERFLAAWDACSA